jgi:hypothetical protein
MWRLARVGLVTSLLLGCGSRTGLESESASDASPGDEAFPEDSPIGDGSSCTPAPAGGLAVGTFSEETISMAVAVAGNTVYVGTAAIGQSSPLYVGAISHVPSSGGKTQPLAAPAYNFGALASDGARLYYPQTSGLPEGCGGGAIYRVLGLASIDLATGAVHPIATVAPPWSTSSNLNSYMIAATPASPGVFWIGGATGSDAASTLLAWDPQSDAVTTIATGEALNGLAVDATGVYWADVGGGQGITVYRSPLGGGSISTLATVPGGTHGQLLGVSSADAVFVTDYATGAIDAVSKAGGPVRPLVTASATWVNDFAWVDDLDLYWTENETPTTLKRIPVTGGPVEIVPTKGSIQSLAFDACNVYIGSYGPARVFVEPM